MARDGNRHAWIFSFELRENLRQDVEAGRLIGTDDELAARRASHFRQRTNNIASRLQGLFRIFQEKSAASGQRDTAAGSIKQSGANILFQSSNLRRNGWLGAKQFLRSAGKTRIACDLDKRFELLKIHGFQFKCRNCGSRTRNLR